MNYNKKLQKVSIVFIGILLAFTFFSQTLADLRIARVTLDFAQTRTVVPEVHSTGTVFHANTRMLFAPIDGTISFLAPVGYSGLSASVLFTIHSDVQELHERLNQALDDQRIEAINIERVRNDISAEQQQIARLTAGAPIVSGLAEYDLQLAANAHEIEIAREDLETQQALFNQGLVPQQLVSERENTLTALELAREQILARRAIAEERQAEQAADQDRARAAQLALHQSAITQLELQLRIHALEAERITNRIAELTEQIEEGGIVEVTAGGNLTVLDVLHFEGARIAEGEPVMMTAIRDQQFRVEALFSQNIHYIEEQRPATVVLPRDLTESEILWGAPSNEVTGRIAQIFQHGTQAMVVIEIESGLFRGGELAQIRIQGPGIHSHQAIPRSALRQDSTGYYMLYVEAVERLFGISYYARVRRIEGVMARGIDGYVATVPAWGITTLEEPIIINSDVPVHEGDRVRPVEVGDFFDTR